MSDGDDCGPGVKLRILELFAQLSKKATTSAQQPAIEILQQNFGVVRDEIQSTFAKCGDPIQGTAELIVESHELRIKRSDAQKRGPILAELDMVLASCPFAENREGLSA